MRAVAPGHANGRHVDGVGISGVNDNAVDVLGLFQANQLEGFSAVHRFEEAAAAGLGISGVAFAGTDPNHIGICGVDFHRADACSGLVVPNGGPGLPRIFAHPDSTGGRAHEYVVVV